MRKQIILDHIRVKLGQSGDIYLEDEFKNSVRIDRDEMGEVVEAMQELKNEWKPPDISGVTGR